MVIKTIINKKKTTAPIIRIKYKLGNPGIIVADSIKDC
jgi:hypothetical protein